jgi:hypothetical protein
LKCLVSETGTELEILICCSFIIVPSECYENNQETIVKDIRMRASQYMARSRVRRNSELIEEGVELSI